MESGSLVDTGIWSLVLHFPLVFGRSGGGGGGARGGDSELVVSVETRTLRLRLKRCRRCKTLWDCRKSGLTKHRAPTPELQFSSRGLRVVIGQNFWNTVGLVLD